MPYMPIIGVISKSASLPKIATPSVAYSGTSTKSLKVTNNAAFSAVAHWSWYNDMDYTSGSGTTIIAAGTQTTVTTVPWDALDSYTFDAYMVQTGYTNSDTAVVYF